MLFSLLNFELHRLGISYKEAAAAAGITEPELLLKLYGDNDFYFDELIKVMDLIGLLGGSASMDHYNPGAEAIKKAGLL